MIPREKHSRSLDSERDRNNVFTEITAWLTTIVLYLGSFYKKERQAARPFIFPTEGLAITFYLSPLPQIDYTRARRREGMTITERGQRNGRVFTSFLVRDWYGIIECCVVQFEIFTEQSCLSKWKATNFFNFSATIEEFKIFLRLKVRVWLPIIGFIDLEDVRDARHFEQLLSSLFNEHEFFSLVSISRKNSKKNSIYLIHLSIKSIESPYLRDKKQHQRNKPNHSIAFATLWIKKEKKKK